MACASVSGCEISLMWSIKFASKTSSKVALNAAINCVGNSEMNPTVSDKIIFWPEGSSTSLIVGSNVANSISFAKTLAPVIWLNNVDLPALV